MKKVTKREIKTTSALSGQKQQPPDLRFCRAWWEFKKALYPTLGTAALRVFLALEDRASRWNNYQVPMSLATLGDETGVKHHTTLAAGIRELEAAGILAVTRHASNSRQANIYLLLIRDLMGNEQEVFANRSNASSDECECEDSCQLAAGGKDTSGNMYQGSDNCSRFNGEVNYTSNREKPKAIGGRKVNANASIPSNQSSHAISAAATTPARAISAENDVLDVPESSPANSGSAKIDSVLTCTNSTNKINWLNPNGFNGVTAEIPPIKLKFDQRLGQRQAGQASQLPEQPGQVSLTAPVASLEKPLAQGANLSGSQKRGEHAEKRFSGAASVAPSNLVLVPASSPHANFEASYYSRQPQKYNYRELREGYFKKLSWATNARERMAVLFSALRLALGEEPGKAEFSGVQGLVNEYGCKAVLAGIVVTISRELDRQAYFAYLRGVIRRQQQGAEYAPAYKYGATRIYHDQSNPHAAQSSKRMARLPIDLAKYAGNGKYAYLTANN